MLGLVRDVHAIMTMHTGYVLTGVRCEISIHAFSPSDRIIDRYKTSARPRDITVTVTTC